MNRFDEKYKLLCEQLENENFQVFIEQTLSEDLATKVFDKIADTEHLIKNGWRILKNKFYPRDEKTFKQKAEEYFKRLELRDKAVSELEQTVKMDLNKKDDNVVETVASIVDTVSSDLNVKKDNSTINLVKRVINKSQNKNKLLKLLEVMFAPLDKGDTSITIRLMYLYLLVIGMLNKDHVGYIDFEK